MRKMWLGGVMSAALLCSTGMVLAQMVLEITPQQERTLSAEALQASGDTQLLRAMELLRSR